MIIILINLILEIIVLIKGLKGYINLCFYLVSKENILFYYSLLRL